MRLGLYGTLLLLFSLFWTVTDETVPDNNYRESAGRLEAIYDYIASNLQSPDTAMQQYDRIAAAIESLDTFPERCKLFDSEPECSHGMRQLLVDNYAVYVVGEVEVTVLRVLYSSSDISSRLHEN